MASDSVAALYPRFRRMTVVVKAGRNSNLADIGPTPFRRGFAHCGKRVGAGERGPGIGLCRFELYPIALVQSDGPLASSQLHTPVRRPSITSAKGAPSATPWVSTRTRRGVSTDTVVRP